MAVEDEVDLIRIEDPHVGLADYGLGGTEDDVREISGDMFAGIVGQGYSDGAENQVDGVVIHAHVGLIH